ncbi:MAG: HPr family phosphocarrier protein [Pseudomonadales bacterium]|jgi:phosphocarrier protein|nr:HPr family phosphocarrier protein [Pseudomonadales bacterium]
MISTTIIVPNKAGLHARAAAKFVATATAFKSKVTLGNSDKSVDGKSILSLMLLAAPQGSELTLTLDGADEDTALKAILALLEQRFGEE